MDTKGMFVFLILGMVFALGYYVGHEACENEAYQIQIDE